MWVSKSLLKSIEEENRQLRADASYYKVEYERILESAKKASAKLDEVEEILRRLAAERDWYKHAYAELKFAAVKHGRWIPVDEKEDAFDCSECDAMVQRRCKFCPGCGAIMDL